MKKWEKSENSSLWRRNDVDLIDIAVFFHPKAENWKYMLFGRNISIIYGQYKKKEAAMAAATRKAKEIVEYLLLDL